MGLTMFSVPITGPTLKDAADQIAACGYADYILEFRLDLFSEYTIDSLATLREKIKQPIIFTLRKKQQGGSYTKSESSRLDEIKRLAALFPTYLDLEYDIHPEFVKAITLAFPTIKFIISYHDFSQTPDDLEVILKKMQPISAHLYKIVTQACSTNDALKMLVFTRKYAPLLGMCMGEKGVLTRILGRVMGSPWTYAYISQKTAEGQLSVEDLSSIYATPQFTQNCALFGLIGGSVSQSLSHYSHNRVMRECNLDAVYVKMAVATHELEEFFFLAKQIGFQGLSVTMPLKEQVIPFLNQIHPDAKRIGAVNTILLQNGTLTGFNTDGIGALEAIEAKMKVHGKKMVIIGAGGAARAIIYEAKRRGAHILVLNRTKEKALDLALEFEVEGGGLELIATNYDILINTTPSPLPIPADAIRSNSLVMDIKTVPKMSPLMEIALKKGCTLVFGYEMFINQALVQYEIWFSSRLESNLAHDVMKSEVLKRLS